jgi:dihydrofolate synthase/folylpolyglutamate synthase
LTSPEPILSRLETLGIRLGLDSVRALLAELGEPQRRFPAVLVAGSNGKGSTAALLAAMATAAGYKTGLYTSPHLETVEERLRIDGRPIATGRLGDLLADLVEAAESRAGSLPTYFEALTVAACRWFAEEAVDLAVVEVGMGGRLDATNLCEPVLSVITSISLEHREHLGDTLAAIAREKAGILRRGRPALAWIGEPEAAAAVRAAAQEIGAGLRSAPELVAIESVDSLGWAGQRVRLATPAGRHDLRIALLGEHQVRNLGLAVLAAEVLGNAGNAGNTGFGRLGAREIAAGAAACRWPGRLEAVELPAGSGARRALLDAAHNPEGAAVLAGFLAGLGEPADLLFGVVADKDAGAMLAHLAPYARSFVFTAPPSPRARNPRDLLPLLPTGCPAAVEPDVEPDIDRALDLALGLSLDRGGTLVVCGSIFLVGDVRHRLRARFGVPPPAAYISGP